MSQVWDTPPPARDVIEQWLDDVRPGLVADGGNVELVSVERDGTVCVTLQGACTTCPARLATFRVAIEEPLKSRFPGVLSVVDVD